MLPDCYKTVKRIFLKVNLEFYQNKKKCYFRNSRYTLRDILLIVLYFK